MLNQKTTITHQKKRTILPFLKKQHTRIPLVRKKKRSSTSTLPKVSTLQSSNNSNNDSIKPGSQSDSTGRGGGRSGCAFGNRGRGNGGRGNGWRGGGRFRHLNFRHGNNTRWENHDYAGHGSNQRFNGRNDYYHQRYDDRNVYPRGDSFRGRGHDRNNHYYPNYNNNNNRYDNRFENNVFNHQPNANTGGPNSNAPPFLSHNQEAKSTAGEQSSDGSSRKRKHETV